MDVNCAVHVLQISSTQKWKNRHLKQCRILNPNLLQKSHQHRKNEMYKKELYALDLFKIINLLISPILWSQFSNQPTLLLYST